MIPAERFQVMVEQRKKYFIDENIEGINQINEHLTYEDLVELFNAKYIEKDTSSLSENLKSKVRHVEICDKCLKWCKYGEAFGKKRKGSSQKFLDEFKKTWEATLEKEQKCADKGHTLGMWVRREYKTATDSEFDVVPVIDGKYTHIEYTKKCVFCSYVDERGTEPEDFNRVGR